MHLRQSIKAGQKTTIRSSAVLVLPEDKTQAQAGDKPTLGPGGQRRGQVVGHQQHPCNQQDLWSLTHRCQQPKTKPTAQRANVYNWTKGWPNVKT
jgi:hypothetical protein